jgi:hypothetical protein
LPPAKIHCTQLVVSALRSALQPPSVPPPASAPAAAPSLADNFTQTAHPSGKLKVILGGIDYFCPLSLDSIVVKFRHET